MTQANNGDTVKVHFTGRLSDGTTFDTSLEREPLELELGSADFIAGFEQAVVGMKPGDTKTVTIAAADAYGEAEPALVFQIDRQKLPEDLQPYEGQYLDVTRRDGSTLPVLVAAVDESEVTLDANHPLAGQELTFEITLVSIG